MAPDKNQKFFTVDARTLLTLGRESIKDHTTAILELVKNGYDAGATIVEVQILDRCSKADRFICISDNGHGMSESDIDEKWLRIGYSVKRTKKKTAGRRRVGEKGIGRLSADRLGATLVLRSQAKRTQAIGLHVNWDAFEEPKKDLVKIPLRLLDNTSFFVPVVAKYSKKKEEYVIAAPKQNCSTVPGTELRISNLRQRWRKDDIKELHKELSVLTPPFDNVKDFQIRLKTDVTEDFNGVIISPFYETAEVEAKFQYKTGTRISYSMSTRNKRGELKLVEKTSIAWENFAHSPFSRGKLAKKEDGDKDTPDTIINGSSFGPVSVTLLFYPRASETLRGTELTLGQLKDFLDANAGIKVYRDNIRVMPYGDLNKAEGGDWLGMGDRKARNPAGAGRSDFRVAPNQVVGAVFLTRDANPKLIDTSGREGLVHGDHFVALKTFIFGCIFRLEAQYHKLFTERHKKAKHRVSPRESVRSFGEDLRALQKSLGEVKSNLPKKGERKIEQVQDQLGATFAQIKDVQKSIEELATQAITYRGLSSLGIATAVFSHETDSALDLFLASLFAARNLLQAEPARLEHALKELAKSIKAGERISAWGRFALRRIRPDKRRRRTLNVADIVKSLLDELLEPFAASDIDLTSSLRKVEGRCFPMDIESVALNLLTNAYYFCKMSRRPRRVHFSLAPRTRDATKGVEITVSDSGPGVSADIKDLIWDALYSTKVDGNGKSFGTGLGLSIVNDVVIDLGGEKEIHKDQDLKGASFRIWLPLI